MKKTLLIPFVVSLVFTLFTGTAFAAVAGRFSAVTDKSHDSLVTGELLPVNIIQSPDKLEIRKIYELGPDDTPDRLPREDFERDGFTYECGDILREEILGGEQKFVTMAVSVESEKNDLNSILTLLPQFRQEQDEYGYSGILTLNTASIKSEIASYGISSSPYSVSRTYPNLPDKHVQCIPDTIDDNGSLLTLQHIQWIGRASANGCVVTPGHYTAYALYSGTRTSSYINSYTITAEYTGQVFKKSVDKIRYTVIFNGSPSPGPSLLAAQNVLENTTADTETAPIKGLNEKPGWFYLSIIFSIVAILVSGVSLYFALRGKSWKNVL